jgi:lipid-A-disaccharide synthase
MKYYVIAGEASGDLHAANLIHELKKLDPDAVFRGWGGDRMQAEGVELVRHYRDLAFMGFAEVILNLRTILRNIRTCKDDLLHWKPDVVILVDYPGFNLRIARFAHEQGLRVFYYISPQVWAWKQSRVHTIKRVVDRMFVILPFEAEFYQSFGYAVDFVGHPLLDEINRFGAGDDHTPGQQAPVIALLPGSRRQEVQVMLPVMAEAAARFPGYTFYVATVPSLPLSFYQSLAADYPVKVWEGKTYALLKQARAALVTSGTATLETALFGVPEVVCYKGSRLSYHIARRLVSVKYISLVNLIMDRPVVTELIQEDMNVARVQEALTALLEDHDRQERLKQDYAALRERLGGHGASRKTAELMRHYLEESR